MGDAGSERGGISKEQRLALTIAVAALVLSGVAAIVLSSSSSSKGKAKLTSIAYPNVDTSNSRHVGGSITAETVSSLKKAWTLPIAAHSINGAYWSTPVIADGVVYSQDSASNVQAIELASGKLLWEKSVGSQVPEANGVVVAGNRVFAASATSAFALNRATGKLLWAVPLTRNRFEGIDMAPGYHDGLVYVSTVPFASKGNEVGILWALNAKTGKKAWSFATVPKSLWGHPEINFGGGVLETPAFDEKGAMYIGVGSPGPVAGTERYPWGTSRPGPNLYTDSLVKLDAATGKIEWHYQLTPHAICDWDLQGPPLLIEAGGRNLVVAAGKGGIVIAVDRETGKLVWKRSVGRHNGHEQDGVRAMRGDFSNLKIPLEVYPGAIGGVASPASTDGERIFVPVVNNLTTLISQERGKSGPSYTGEVVALDAASGAVEWKHFFNSATMGATSAVNDLVFGTTLTGSVFALAGESGEQVWGSGLPAGTLAGLAFTGNMMIAPAGNTLAGSGGLPGIVAYKLQG
jgi:outer membrane protein assembly factor BamB